MLPRLLSSRISQTVLLSAVLGILFVSQAAPDYALIKRHFASIEGQIKKHQLATSTRDLMGYSAEGGDLRVWGNKTAPQKISARFFGESGQKNTDFYFWQGKLFFALETSQFYKAGLGSPVARREENRYYFDKGKLVRWIGPNHKNVPVTGEQEKQFLADVRQWLQMARTAK